MSNTNTNVAYTCNREDRCCWPLSTHAKGRLALQVHAAAIAACLQCEVLCLLCFGLLQDGIHPGPCIRMLLECFQGLLSCNPLHS